jgi:hypothetical protein
VGTRCTWYLVLSDPALIVMRGMRAVGLRYRDVSQGTTHQNGYLEGKGRLPNQERRRRDNLTSRELDVNLEITRKNVLYSRYFTTSGLRHRTVNNVSEQTHPCNSAGITCTIMAVVK